MSIKDLVHAYEALDRVDLRVLRIVELAHRRYEYVPVEVIMAYSSTPKTTVSRSLAKLNRLGMLVRRVSQYTGYRLTFLGYDCLAIHTLRKRGIVEYISSTPIGVGKESVVYVGWGTDGDKYVLKFHRVGLTSFKNVRRLRAWLGDRRHVTEFYESRLSAQMEYRALALLNGRVSVPRPIDVNRHVVVMGHIEGIELYRLRELDEPRRVLEAVINEAVRAYEIGVVHGDLSEYNVLVDVEGRAWLIDWPQWVPTTHESAHALFRRDMERVATFFAKRFGISMDLSQVLSAPSKASTWMSVDSLVSEILKRIEDETREE